MNNNDLEETIEFVYDFFDRLEEAKNCPSQERTKKQKDLLDLMYSDKPYQIKE